MVSSLPVYYSDAFLNHDTGGHPENAHRLTAIINTLDKDLVTGKVELRNPGAASADTIAYNHDMSYYEMVKQEVNSLREGQSRHLDPDTIISTGSLLAAEKAAGTGIDMLKNYYGQPDRAERENRAIALPRPPGHHACESRAMGFCLFNNIAIAAHAAIRDYGLERVAIYDWDVHHGNGTEESFYTRKDVLYISSHQYPAFPGTGTPPEIGRNEGKGFNVNLPLPPVSGDAEIRYYFLEIIMPILEQYDPQLLLISAGYDAHERDPLASLAWTTQVYAWMAAYLDKFCLDRKIPMFAFLEGGYEFIALTAGVLETMSAMRGEVDIVEYCNVHTDVMDSVIKTAQDIKYVHSDYWKFS